MKNLITLSLGVVLAAGACAPYYVGPAGPAPGPVYGSVTVAVQDRPYYVRGPYYIESGRRYVWVAGHWSRRHGRKHWVHGHYALRGY